jgi:anti-anti-sigma factor
MDCHAHLTRIEPDSDARPSVIRRSLAATSQSRARLSVLTVSGTLRAPLESNLSRAVEAGIRRGERQVLLDLAELTDIDAAGVGELVRAFNAAQAAGGILRIVRANRYVRRLLQVAGLFTLLIGGGTR